MSAAGSRPARSRALLAGVGRRRSLYAALATGVLAAALIAVLAARAVAPGSVAASPLGGKPAPPIAGSSLVGGRPVSLASLRGRYVVVDFFASWCGPCQAEEPAIESFLWMHRHQPVSVLGVTVADTAANARSFLQRVGASWPAVVDGSGSIAYAYGVADPPQSFLVAPDGRVVGHYTGQLTLSFLDRWLAGAEQS